MRLRSSLLEVIQLTWQDRARMFSLMQQCYENTSRDAFEHDLDQKWLVILVQDPISHQLVGFSTQVLLETTVEGAQFGRRSQVTPLWRLLTGAIQRWLTNGGSLLCV